MEVVFLGSLFSRAVDLSFQGEPGATPEWLSRDRLRRIDLRPPIAGYLPAVMQRHRSDAAHLGNMWRPRTPSTT